MRKLRSGVDHPLTDLTEMTADSPRDANPGRDVLCSSADTQVPVMDAMLPAGVLHLRINLSPGCLLDHFATEAKYST